MSPGWRSRDAVARKAQRKLRRAVNSMVTDLGQGGVGTG
jgi:hypothetical protein